MENTDRLDRWLYDRVLTGVPGFSPLHALHEHCQQRHACPRAQTRYLIRWHVGQAGVVALLTSWGGFTTMPLALSANLVAERFLALRLTSGIAAVHGWSLEQEHTFRQITACVAGEGATERLADPSGQLMAQWKKSLQQQAVQQGQALLLRHLGHTTFKSAARVVPLVSLAVGLGFDTHAMYRLGRRARKVFAPEAISA